MELDRTASAWTILVMSNTTTTTTTTETYTARAILRGSKEQIIANVLPGTEETTVKGRVAINKYHVVAIRRDGNGNQFATAHSTEKAARGSNDYSRWTTLIAVVAIERTHDAIAEVDKDKSPALRELHEAMRAKGVRVKAGRGRARRGYYWAVVDGRVVGHHQTSSEHAMRYAVKVAGIEDLYDAMVAEHDAENPVSCTPEMLKTIEARNAAADAKATK